MYGRIRKVINLNLDGTCVSLETIFRRHYSSYKVRPLLVKSLVIVVFYVIFLMRYAVIIILEKKTFPIKRKQWVSNCFKGNPNSQGILN